MCIMLIGVIALITVTYSCVNNISVCARCASHSKLKGCEVFNFLNALHYLGINDGRGIEGMFRIPRLHAKHETFNTSLV